MIDAGPAYVLMKIFRRVLADYPLAREQLAAHQGKTIAIRVGPLNAAFRISASGDMELAGDGAAADLSFTIPLSLLPRLARKDESAWHEVQFQGDSELASTFSTIARNVEWDIEEDLSRVVGDIAAHRLVSGAKSFFNWQADARQRWTENVAEYLAEEKRSFIVQGDLEHLTRANETLRDDIARLDARLARVAG